MRLVAGVDGGGTGTRALILDEAGVERGRGEGPPGLVTRKDLGAAAERVADAVEVAVTSAMEAAGKGATPSSTDSRPGSPSEVGERRLAHLCAGVAGAGSEEAREAVRAALEARALAEALTVTTDVDVALRDAFPAGEPGILLVSGTGSMAAGRSSDGETVRAGGWGALLDDVGSGYWIALEGLRALLRSVDGRAPETALTEPLLAAMDVAGPEDLVTAVDRASKARIAGMAPLVVQTAEKGDSVAAGVLDEAVRELVALVDAVSTGLRRPGDGDRVSPETSSPPVALHGGLVGSAGPLHETVCKALQGAGYGLVDRPVSPIRGAARTALEAARDS